MKIPKSEPQKTSCEALCVANGTQAGIPVPKMCYLHPEHTFLIQECIAGGNLADTTRSLLEKLPPGGGDWADSVEALRPVEPVFAELGIALARLHHHNPASEISHGGSRGFREYADIANVDNKVFLNALDYDVGNKWSVQDRENPSPPGQGLLELGHVEEAHLEQIAGYVRQSCLRERREARRDAVLNHGDLDDDNTIIKEGESLSLAALIDFGDACYHLAEADVATLFLHHHSLPTFEWFREAYEQERVRLEGGGKSASFSGSLDMELVTFYAFQRGLWAIGAKQDWLTQHKVLFMLQTIAKFAEKEKATST